MGFTKLDEGIVFSSIMGEDDATFRAWIILLATCKADGISRISEVFLSTIMKKDLAEVEKCLSILTAEDKNSRTKDNDGKRIERVDGGFKILNYEKYRERTATDYFREKKRIQRENEDCPGQSKTVPGLSASASSSSSDSGIRKDSSKDEGGTGGKKEKTWKEDFAVYSAELKKQWTELLKDADWLSDLKKYNPGLDVRLSLEKAMNLFWGLEAGWKHKKKKRAATIDLKATLTNALSIKSNQVWERRGTK